MMVLCVLACAVAGTPLAWRSGPVLRRRAALLVARAEDALAAHESDRARGFFRAALRLRPDDTPARRQLASLELGVGNWELALLELQSIVEFHPEDSEGWISLAAAKLQNGWLEAPEAALDTALELAPGSADARRMRAEIRFRLGRYYAAHEDAAAATAAMPADAASWALLAATTFFLQGVDAGIDAARRGLVAAGPDPALRVVLASLLGQAHRTQEAVAILEQEIAAAPASSERARNGQLALARVQAVAGNREAAARAVGPQRAPPRWQRIDGRKGGGTLGAWNLEQWPGRLGELRDRLEHALQEQSFGEAQHLVDAAQRLYPGSGFGPFMAGVSQLAHGSADAAERDFSEALLAAPRFPTVIAALGRTWSTKGGAAFAGNRLMQLAERDPQLASARYLAARAYMEAGDPGKAEAALRRGLQLQPDSPIPVRHLTDYYFGLERTPEALEVCLQGLDRFPQDVGLRMMAAQIEAGLGRTQDAIRVFEELAAQRPDLDNVQYRLATLLAAKDEAHTAPQRTDDPQTRQRFLEIVRRLQADLPADPLQMDALGWLLFRAGDLPRARSLLETAVQGAPDEPGPRFHLATLCARQGEPARAREELKIALDSPRPFPERLEAMRLLRESGGSADRKTAVSGRR